MGAAQPRCLHARAPDPGGISRRAHGRLTALGARLLPGHRRRRRRRDDPAPTARPTMPHGRLMCWPPPRKSRIAKSRKCRTLPSPPRARPANAPTRNPDTAPPTSTWCSSTMRSPSIRSCSLRISASVRRAKAGASWPKAISPPAENCRSTPMAAGLSCTHPGMYGLFTLIEATEQIMGTAGARQQQNVELALAHGNGAVLSSQATVILGSADTL